MAPAPWSFAFVVVVFATYGFVLVFLRRAAGCGWLTVAVAALAMCAWLGASGAMAGTGLLVSDVTAVPPLLLRYVVLPAVAAVLLLTFLPATGAFLDRVPADWLISYQANRIAVEVILHGLFLAGVVHGRLTYVGWNFDIATGVGALGVGYLVHKRRAPRWLVPAFNVAGLLLLTIIVSMAVLSVPTPWQRFGDPPELRVPLHVPFVWLPAFVVPLALLGHLLSLRKWLRGTQNISV